jgi:hypothetical protein
MIADKPWTWEQRLAAEVKARDYWDVLGLPERDFTEAEIAVLAARHCSRSKEDDLIDWLVQTSDWRD